MKKVLVVVDMQNDFIDGALGTKEAEEIVDKVVDKIKNYDGEILLTLDTHHADYLETKEGQSLPVPHCIKMTSGWMLKEEIVQALKNKTYKLLEKNSFGSIKLAKKICKISQKEEMEIELVGLCTDICVVSNALILKAHFPEWNVLVDATCCAGVTRQSHHAAVQTMKACQITVLE